MTREVAVTGATGFIGRALLARLIGGGTSLRCLSRRAQPPTANVRWIHGDLSELSALRRLVDGVDAVVHCAGVVRGGNADAFWQVNVEGTRYLLQAINQQSVRARLLFMSSLAAREPALSWYATSKRQAEELLQAGGTEWTILRPTAVYGPGDREMRPLFAALARGWLVTPALDDMRFSLLHVDDLVRLIQRWLENETAPADVFEVDDGVPGGYDWRQLRRTGETVFQRPVRVLRLPLPLLYGLAHANLYGAKIFRYAPMLTPGKVREITHRDWICDNSPIAQALQWVPKTNLEEALAAGSY